MIENTRKLREIEIFNPHLQLWVKTTGFYPESWICANPNCIRTTKAKRRLARHDKHYCSCKCRGEHEMTEHWKQWRKDNNKSSTPYVRPSLRKD